jgi:hypothetical protein
MFMQYEILLLRFPMMACVFNISMTGSRKILFQPTEKRKIKNLRSKLKVAPPNFCIILYYSIKETPVSSLYMT